MVFWDRLPPQVEVWGLGIRSLGGLSTYHPQKRGASVQINTYLEERKGEGTLKTWIANRKTAFNSEDSVTSLPGRNGYTLETTVPLSLTIDRKDRLQDVVRRFLRNLLLMEEKVEALRAVRGATCFWRKVYNLSDELVGETWNWEDYGPGTHILAGPLRNAQLLASVWEFPGEVVSASLCPSPQWSHAEQISFSCFSPSVWLFWLAYWRQGAKPGVLKNRPWPQVL